MLNISRGRASNQIRYARALRERLPAVAKAFATGVIDCRMILTIIARTENVDDEVVPQLDEALARHVAKWMRFSEPKLRDRLDLWVAKFDPAAVRIPPKVDEDRFVQIQPDGPGMALIWGSIHATDAAAFAQRLDALVASVCPEDPRTAKQRRADACGAMARQEARLACQADPPAMHRPRCATLTTRCRIRSDRRIRRTTSCTAASKTGSIPSTTTAVLRRPTRRTISSVEPSRPHATLPRLASSAVASV